MMKEKNRFAGVPGFNLDPLVRELQKIPNQAIEKIKTSDKNSIELIEDYLNTKIRNDSMLVKRLVRVYFSAYTNEPINCLLLSPTSEGKTYSTIQISEIFPKEDIIAVGRLSPTALIHQQGILVDPDGEPLDDKLNALQKQLFEAQKSNNRDEIWEIKQVLKDIYATARNMVDLTHKILIFLDNPRPDTYEMLKPILSHDKKEISYKTTKGDGSLTVKDTIVKGWPATIICSAKNESKNEVWQEIASREFILSPNTDVSKYRSANKLTSVKFGLPSVFTENIDEKEVIKFFVERQRETLQKLCKNGNNPVMNLFAEKMAELFPSNEGIAMRHFKRLLSFCNIETLVNSKSNMKIEFQFNNDKKIQVFVITSIKMIDNAIKILGNISTVSPEKIKFHNKVFLPLIEERYSVQASFNQEQQKIFFVEDDQELTSNELAEKYTKIFHKTITPKQVVENYLEPLVSDGILEQKPNPQNKRQNLYYVSSKLSVSNLEDINRQLIDIVDNQFSYIWSCLIKPFQSSTKIGKMTRIFDNTNPKITCLEFKTKISGNILKSIDN